MNLGGQTLVQDNATVTASTDRITAAAHGLSDGDLVVFADIVTVTALVEGAKYYVRNATTDDFQVSATRGGAVLALDADGTVDVYSAVPSYTGQDMRRIQSGLLQRGDASGGFAARPGVFPNASTTGHVSVSGTTWTVQPRTVVVNHATAGPYLVAFAGDSGSLDPADGTNPRIDGLDLQVRDDDEDASGFRDSRIVYVPGTPASSPVAPAVTTSSERLATILVPAGGTPDPSINTGPRFTVARGGVVPVADSTAYPGSGGRYEGLLLWNSATDQLVVNMNAGATWQVLSTAGGQSFLGQQIFTTSDTFEIANFPGAQSVVVHVQGAGGGGGGCSAADVDGASVGAGGAAGQYRRGRIAVASLAASETVTIGAGGSGGADGLSAGSAGGSSSFGTHITAVGGNAGQSDHTSGPGTAIRTGGATPTGGSGGDITINGGAGENGIHGAGFVASQGNGGASVFAMGGRASATNDGANGPDAPGPGAGGSGGHDNNTGTRSARSGGDGAAGLVIVEVWG